MKWDDVYVFIDKFPEMPYFFLAFIYVVLNPLVDYWHFFSVGFLFLSAGLSIGVLLKLIFRTKRPRSHYTFIVLRYGFPSLHSLISVGAVFYVYFVSPILSFILAPVGVLYICSRIKLGYHTKTDVLGGAVLGLFLGCFFGLYGLGIVFPTNVKYFLTLLFFLLPLSATMLRFRSHF